MGCCGDSARLGWSFVTQDWLTLLDFQVDRMEFAYRDRLKDLARIDSFGIIEEVIKAVGLTIYRKQETYSKPLQSLIAAEDLM